jgi:hypothetical protein
MVKKTQKEISLLILYFVIGAIVVLGVSFYIGTYYANQQNIQSLANWKGLAYSLNSDLSTTFLSGYVYSISGRTLMLTNQDKTQFVPVNIKSDADILIQDANDIHNLNPSTADFSAIKVGSQIDSIPVQIGANGEINGTSVLITINSLNGSSSNNQ